MLLLTCTVFGQQIKTKNVEADDIITLLDAAGYKLFSFDITEMLNERYDIVFVRKEFEAGKEIDAFDLTTASNKRLLTDFPEFQWQEIIDEGMVIDAKAGALALAEKITFGFYPSDNDSTRLMQINVPKIMSMHGIQFKLRGFTQKNSDKMSFFYHTRPFKMKAVREDEFIPLILFGSAWYDERFDIFRFCGENEIEPDMSSEILKEVPHHYVIGVKFVKRQ
jgi:hypothetical protein